MTRHLVGSPRQTFLALVAVFMAAPLVVVAGVSLNATWRMSFPPERLGWNWYEAFFTSPAWLSALQWSLLIASAAALVATSIAVPVAYAIWRFNSHFSKLLSGLGTLAFMLPPVVLVVVFMIFWGFVGHVGRVENTVLSHSVVLLALPLVTVSLGFQSIDRSLIEAAGTMGATDNYVFRTVIAPIVMPYVLCGALFVFVLSINEYFIEQGRRVVEPAMRDHAETERRPVGALSHEEQRVVARRDDAGQATAGAGRSASGCEQNANDGRDYVGTLVVRSH